MIDELDRGWEDVLRRARRRRAPRRAVLLGVVAVAALGGGPALGVLLTRSTPPRLAVDQISGPVSVVSDTRVRRPLLEFGRWKGHNGICYLVPHVHAGCLLRGERTQLFSVVPFLIRRLVHGKHRPVLIRHVRYRVAVVGSSVRLVDAHGRVFSVSPLRR